MENTKDTIKADLVARYGADDVFTTDELTTLFTVESFACGFCFASRKSDGVQGSLDFTHSPRFYYQFRPRSY